jgi:ABC-type lipoprotein release transport system permease subunit
MKCLGALDSFILKLFFLESLFLGAAGSCLGALLGILLTEILARQGHGAEVVIPWGTCWLAAGASMGIGLAITAAAALYPAWRAARMDPIAAMRVEV